MNEASLIQRFAVDNNGRMVSINDVLRGGECGCFCPACGAPVIAKQGEVRVWHFSHRSGVDCASGAETAIHLAAKQVIADHKGLMLPGASAYRSVTLPDGREGVGEARIEAIWCDFHNITVEAWLGGLRPDVLAEAGGRPFIVEVAVSHFVDDAKRRQLVERSLPAIEIDLSGMNQGEWEWVSLEAVVIDGTETKSWLFCPWAEEMEAAALKAARQDAASKPEMGPRPEGGVAKSNRTRYWLEGRIVDVIDLGFGVAVWSAYDPVFVERIKSLVKPLGARWKQQYKKWLLPANARTALIQRLEEAGAKN